MPHPQFPPKYYQSPLGESPSLSFQNVTDALRLDPILDALLNGKPLPEKEKKRLLCFQPTPLTHQFEHLFEKAKSARKFFSTTRQLQFVLMKTIPDESTSSDLAMSRINISWAQLATEMVDIVDFFRNKNHLNYKEAPKLLCIVIGMAALTATALGLGGNLLLNVATALRGLTSGLKSLIRQMENERKLKICAIELMEIKQELATLATHPKTEINAVTQQQLMANCLIIQEKHDKLEKEVDSNASNAMERVTQMANLSIVIGAIMLCFPVTAPIGAWLVLVGNAVKFALGVGSAAQSFADFKERYLSTTLPDSPTPNAPSVP